MAARAVVTMSAPVAIGDLDPEHLEAMRFQTFFYNGILASQLKGLCAKSGPRRRPRPTSIARHRRWYRR